MHCKIRRIILEDFKSYRGKISVGPFHDFTCVVGPNGGGKSNLMDALTMALSADSSTVRGIEVREFINRQSQASQCSVTVVVQHSNDGLGLEPRGRESPSTTAVRETSFTRRVSKENQSIFEIDGKAVRQDTYIEQLALLHVSKRASNFIVFQHEVESVTQKTPAELTALLEEVSGSSELKDEYNLKKKALRDANEFLSKASLEKRGAAVEANQMRLIKKEIERYEELQREMRQERWNVSMAELFYVDFILEQQKAELKRFQETLHNLQKSIPTESHIREMKQQFISHHKTYLEELHNGRSLSDELRTKLSLLERAKASGEYMARHQILRQKELETLHRETAQQRAERQRLESQKERYEALLKEFDEETEQDIQKMSRAVGTLGQGDLDEYHRLQVEAECQTVTKRQQRETLEKQREALNAALQECRVGREHHQKRMKELQDNIRRLQQHRTEMEHRKQELHANVRRLEQEIKAAQKSQADGKKRFSEREADLYKLQEQLRELRHMRDNDKQNSRSVETLQALQSLYGVKGRLVDLCSIPDNTYRNALTVALGKNLDAVIVDTTEVAIQCVSYLKEQRLPSMTFLPLNSVTGKEVTDRLRTFGGTCKPMVDVIRYDAAIAPAVCYALGDTLVCSTLAEAKRVAYGGRERYKVVTLDGTVLTKQGTIQGGLASIESRARKWDDKKYEELRSARDRLLQETAAGGEAEMAHAAMEIRDMGARLDFTRERMKVVEEELTMSTTKIAAAIQEEARAEDNEKALMERESRYLSDQERIAARISDVEQEIKSMVSAIFAELQKRVNIEEILEVERKQQDHAKERGQRRQKLVVVIHKLGEALEAEEKRFEWTRMKDVQAAYERTEKEQLHSKQQVAALEEECKTLKARHATVKKGLVAMREHLDALQQSIRETTATSEKELHRLTLARKGGAGLEAACDGLRQQRISILRRCQMDGIEIPLKPASGAGGKRGRDESTPSGGDDATASQGPSRSEAFSLSEGGARPTEASQEAKGALFIDFTGIPAAVRAAAKSRDTLTALQQRTQASLETLAAEIEMLGPHLKAASRLPSSVSRLDQSAALLEEARERVRRANAEFQDVRKRRSTLFMGVYEKMAVMVDKIYKELTIGTRSRGAPGAAYLSLEDAEDPFLGGTAYHATPPLKRFMAMDMLSGGERTMAALAFLFAVHAIAPAPFFVLDEVDAALDAANVEKLARYVRQNAKNCQFLVVSHKDQLYYLSDVLLGVTSEKKDVSQILSLDLRGYSF